MVHDLLVFRKPPIAILKLHSQDPFILPQRPINQIALMIGQYKSRSFSIKVVQPSLIYMDGEYTLQSLRECYTEV